MNITTSQGIWANPLFLSLVHQTNAMIESEAGPKSETLSVCWGVVPTGGAAQFALQLTVVNAASPQAPFMPRDVSDQQSLRLEFRQWCGA